MKRAISCSVCIVGLGPAGLGAGLRLARHKLSKGLICVEQGSPSDNRSCRLLDGDICRKEKVCQVVSGIGGCSLLGGGKVSNYPAGGGLARILGREKAIRTLRESIEMLSEYLPLKEERVRPGEIKEAQRYYSALGFEYRYFQAYRFAPAHAGEAYRRMAEEITSGGSSVLFETELEGIEQTDSKMVLRLKCRGEDIVICADRIVLAVGRSGHSLLKRLNLDLGLGAIAGQIDIGVRLDFPSTFLINKVQEHQDLKLLFDGARTFCVCQSGRIAVYRMDEAFFTEGFCDANFKTERTNLGILRRFPPSEGNNGLLEEIKKKAISERDGNIAFQTLQEYLLEAHTSRVLNSISLPDSVLSAASVDGCFPRTAAGPVLEAVRYFAERMLARNRWADISVLAPEVDYAGTMYPVKSDFRIRDGIYLVGDCTGMFRGIAQAFASGVVCADSLMRNG